ncbi:ABC-2 family transporter protein [Paenibacillus sp. FSL H8-0332]|uniref:ABC transporter permease n=1 Tax=Paenibacillus sp. FSL H8-0332 TaxID=2954742 RepID=UPI0030D07EF9
MRNAFNLYYITIVKGVRQFTTYRTNVFAGVTSALFMLGVRYALWIALFRTGNGGNSTLIETITYFVVMDILMVWTTSTFSEHIGKDIHSGDISHALTRPCSYHFQLVMALHSKAVVSTFTSSLPILIAATVFIGILPPVSTVTFGLFILAAILGGAIYILIDLIISYSVFWLMGYWYIRLYKGALFMLFGGTVLPLWFYPDWLRMISNVLPFQFSLFIPMEIYLGRIRGEDVVTLLVMQLFWIGLLFAIERFVWYRVQNKIVVQGG